MKLYIGLLFVLYLACGEAKVPCRNYVNCLVDPCMNHPCPLGFQCVSNYCGGCNASCQRCKKTVPCPPCTLLCMVGHHCVTNNCGTCTHKCYANLTATEKKK